MEHSYERWLAYGSREQREPPFVKPPFVKPTFVSNANHPHERSEPSPTDSTDGHGWYFDFNDNGDNVAGQSTPCPAQEEKHRR